MINEHKFKGHQFVKLVNNNWVLDLTEYKGYKVDINKQGEYVNYTEAFRIYNENGDINFDKYESIPVKILKEAKNQVLSYESEIST